MVVCKPNWGVQRTCEVCGSVFQVFPSAVTSGGGRFCSRKCFYTTRRFAVRGARAALLLAYERGYRVEEDGSVRSPHGTRVKTRANTYQYLAFKIRGALADITVHRLAAYQKYGKA